MACRTSRRFFPPRHGTPTTSVIVALAGAAKTSAAKPALIAAAPIEGLSDEDVRLAALPRHAHDVDRGGAAAERVAGVPDHGAAVVGQGVRSDATEDPARAAIDRVDAVADRLVLVVVARQQSRTVVRPVDREEPARLARRDVRELAEAGPVRLDQ